MHYGDHPSAEIGHYFLVQLTPQESLVDFTKFLPLCIVPEWPNLDSNMVMASLSYCINFLRRLRHWWIAINHYVKQARVKLLTNLCEKLWQPLIDWFKLAKTLQTIFQKLLMRCWWPVKRRKKLVEIWIFIFTLVYWFLQSKTISFD